MAQNNRFGKINDGQGKPDPRTFSTDNPQPDPVHDVDPARLSFTAPEPPTKTQRRKQTATDVDQKIAEREGQRDEMIDAGHPEDLMLAASPMDDLVDRHREAGFSYGFMARAVNSTWGTRGYEVVKDERGDPVTLGTLTLGKIPTRVAEARRRKAEQASHARVKEIRNQYAQGVEKLKRDARDMGLRVLEPGEARDPEYVGPGRHISV